MITLYKFGPAYGLPTASPYALKLETWLRMTNIPYEVEIVTRTIDSPKQTVPYIGEDGKLLADTGFIIEHLKRKTGRDLDVQLSDEQRAVAHAARRMLEESLARILGWTRWMTDENWPVTRELAFGKVPEEYRDKVSTAARKGFEEVMRRGGIGRHTPEEIQAIGLDDIRAVESLLGGHPYLMGAEPTEVDASAFGIVAQYILTPLECTISTYARNSAVLSAYVERMKQRFFPECGAPARP
jgi:glutathione S-transferase